MAERFLRQSTEHTPSLRQGFVKVAEKSIDPIFSDLARLFVEQIVLQKASARKISCLSRWFFGL